MKSKLDINPKIVEWAITRKGDSVSSFIKKFSKVEDWLNNKKKPTVKELEEFANKVYLPFGYFFLPEPPEEDFPIPYFRTEKTQTPQINIHVYDIILLLQQRQDWLRNYLKDNNFQPLPFVGKYKNHQDIQSIEADIRTTLNLPEDWASQFKTWEQAQEYLVTLIEKNNIIVVFNSIVGNNTHRSIPIEECRGFVLVDEYAPFMFVNSADFKAAQMFTIMHELAHIWIGQSASFDFRNLLPAQDQKEILCDKIAAEILVPKKKFHQVWSEHPYDYQFASSYFKVSEIVIARRALDTNQIDKKKFFEFYKEYDLRSRKKTNRGMGGNFYKTTKKRISGLFANYVFEAVKSYLNPKLKTKNCTKSETEKPGKHKK